MITYFMCRSHPISKIHQSCSWFCGNSPGKNWPTEKQPSSLLHVGIINNCWPGFDHFLFIFIQIFEHSQWCNFQCNHWTRCQLQFRRLLGTYAYVWWRYLFLLQLVIIQFLCKWTIFVDLRYVTPISFVESELLDLLKNDTIPTYGIKALISMLFETQCLKKHSELFLSWPVSYTHLTLPTNREV